MVRLASGITTPSLSGALTRIMPGALLPLRFLGEAADGDIFFKFAETIRQFVLVADIGEAFEFAGAGRGDHHVFAA